MTLSIGSVGTVVFDPSNSRWKGFLPRTVANAAEAETLLAEILHSCAEGTRFTMRVFAAGGRGDYENVRVAWFGHNASIGLEAFIPLSDEGGIAYFGGNALSRGAASTELEVGLAERVAKMSNAQHDLSGFRVGILERVTTGDVQDVTEIYRASFTDYMVPLVPATVAKILRENLVCVARDPKGKVVSVVVAERSRVGCVDIVELSEMATLPEFRGRGINIAAARMIMGVVGDALVYMEARATWGGIIRVATALGMRFGGVLPLHCVIASDSQDILQTGRFGDLAVMYLPPSTS